MSFNSTPIFVFKAYINLLRTISGLFSGILTYIIIILTITQKINYSTIPPLSFIIFVVIPIIHLLLWIDMLFKVYDESNARKELIINLTNIFNDESFDNIIHTNLKRLFISNEGHIDIKDRKLLEGNLEVIKTLYVKGFPEKGWDLVKNQSFFILQFGLKSQFEVLAKDIGYNVAERLLKENEYSSAYETVNKCLKIVDEQPDLLMLKGQIEIKLNNEKRGKNTIKKAEKLEKHQKALLKKNEKKLQPTNNQTNVGMRH